VENKSISHALKQEIQNNKIILFPTDTVYGLLANGYSKIAMDNLFDVKKRPKEKTFAIFVDINRLENYVWLNERNKMLFKKFTPGAVTFILKNRDRNLNHLEIDGKIAIRIPKNKFLQKLLSEIEFPLIATSANLSGQKSTAFYYDVDDEIKSHPLVHNKNYEFLLDEEPLSLSSSIFDISEDQIKTIRL